MKGLVIAALSANLLVTVPPAASAAGANSAASYPNCHDAPEAVLLDLSAHDLLGSDEPADLLFAAVMSETRLLPTRPDVRDAPCLHRPGALPESSSRYLLQLIDKFPGFHPGYQVAIAYCAGNPVTLAQCPMDAATDCTVDEDATATADLCGKNLARLWVNSDPENGIAQRELAMQHYRQGEVGEAYAALERALQAQWFDAYTREQVQAIWGSARRLYPQPTLDYLLRSESPVTIPGVWDMNLHYDYATFGEACKTESATDEKWLDLCLALAERIEAETDMLLEAALANGIARSLLADHDRPEAAARATQRKQAREELTDCFSERLDENSATQVLQTLDAMARFGEIEAMRRICNGGLPVVPASSQSAH